MKWTKKSVMDWMMCYFNNGATVGKMDSMAVDRPLDQGALDKVKMKEH